MLSNLKIKLVLFAMFIILNGIVYIVNNINTQDKIDSIMDANLKILKAHYDVLLESQRKTSLGIYEFTISIDRVSQIMKEAAKASSKDKAKLREELKNLVADVYKIAKDQDVLQYQFVLPNNESFYRAHKPSKFGDNIDSVRSDFVYVHKNKKQINGFSQGRTAHAFRNTFPIFDKNKLYVGAIEISFSSDTFQWYLNNVSDIHSHFLVSKKIFNAKAWRRDDLVLKYVESAESKDYMLNLGSIYSKDICVVENQLKLKPIREEIDSQLLLGRGFSRFVRHHDHFDLVSFLPINNIEGENVAWVVSFEESTIIRSTMLGSYAATILSFFVSMLILYFMYKRVQSRAELKKQHRLLNDILNSTDDIMFITDFKDVTYSNNRFRNFFNVKNNESINTKYEHDFVNVFVCEDGFLHEGLLEANEDFISLISRTLPKDRVVRILDKNFEQKAFKISVSKSENNLDYLVTLSDVTRMKEYQLKAEEKAYLDGLTKVYNRNKFDEIFEYELNEAQSLDTPLSIAILDIDKFKDFNDMYGHLIGDEVLKQMAKTIQENVRDTDTFARWGGEEFVILFKNTNLDIAKVVSEKLREKVQANKHSVAGRITASFGITEYKHLDNAQSIFKRCDDALYIAKQNGRNRVEVL